MSPKIIVVGRRGETYPLWSYDFDEKLYEYLKELLANSEMPLWMEVW